MKLSISHPELTMLRIEVNGKICPHITIASDHYLEITDDCDIEIFFEPWKIKPLIRLNRHLIDYWLGNIIQYDHMVKFRFTSNFYNQYQQKIFDSKRQYLRLSNKDEIDYYLGINNAHLDIVDEIKKFL